MLQSRAVVIIEGYGRVKIKIKELRRGYKNAVDTESRSGSGELVSKKFELLSDIWDGSPAVSSFASAITSQENQHDTESAESDSEAERKVKEVTLGNDTDTNIKVSKIHSHSIAKPKENNRNHMAKNIAREESHIKNKVYEAMHKQIEQAVKHSVARSKKIYSCFRKCG